MNNWMKNIPDDFLVSEINLPGTHDSTTQFIRFPHFSRCQNKNIFEQLKMGIRFIDIRFRFDGKELKLSHSIFNCKNSRRKNEDLLFSDVLADCKTFLKENPTETVLMCIKREAGKSEEECFDFFYNTFVKDETIFFSKNKIPYLSEVRGKIVLLNRCGADINNEKYTDENTGLNLTGWPYQNSKNEAYLQKIIIPERRGKSENFFYVQDFFNLNPKKKWEIAVLPSLENAPQDKSVVLNFFSGSNGFSSPKRYSKILFKNFSGYELIPMKKYGWFILDFPDKKIIKKIILSNY